MLVKKKVFRAKKNIKMTTLNLLEINVDSLFEQCGIAEIDQVHKKLQQNIEEKKEELRIMVGYVKYTVTLFTFPSPKI